MVEVAQIIFDVGGGIFGLGVGAANFSRSGLTEQNNDLEILRGAGVCASFERAFAAMWGAP